MRSRRSLLRLPWAVMLCLVAAVGTRAAAGTVDQSKVCFDCHAGVAGEIAGAVKHPPAQRGECSSCHNPHAARDASLLLARPAILCAECHGEIASELARPRLHRPVAEGRCTECHEPHGGQHSGLLAAPGSELCRNCHEQVGAWRDLAVQHSPFARGRCSSCHEPHGAEHPGLSRKAGASTCVGCHPTSQKFLSVHRGYPVDRADCQQCHDPHASNQSGLFREQAHPPFASGECGTCHAAPGADQPFRLVDRQDRLCGDCHEDQVRASIEAPFPHVAAGGSGCSSCHNPHSGTEEGLLNRPTRELCLSCHDPGGASSGAAGRYSTHADLACTLCHSPHGGERPLFLRSEAVGLCGSCHSHQHAIAHPMGEAAHDPRNGQPLDCLSCHGVHDAPHKKYLHRGGERELCIGCHQEIGRRR